MSETEQERAERIERECAELLTCIVDIRASLNRAAYLVSRMSPGGARFALRTVGEKVAKTLEVSGD